MVFGDGARSTPFVCVFSLGFPFAVITAHFLFQEENVL